MCGKRTHTQTTTYCSHRHTWHSLFSLVQRAKVSFVFFWPKHIFHLCFCSCCYLCQPKLLSTQHNLSQKIVRHWRKYTGILELLYCPFEKNSQQTASAMTFTLQVWCLESEFNGNSRTLPPHSCSEIFDSQVTVFIGGKLAFGGCHQTMEPLESWFIVVVVVVVSNKDV